MILHPESHRHNHPEQTGPSFPSEEALPPPLPARLPSAPRAGQRAEVHSTPRVLWHHRQLAVSRLRSTRGPQPAPLLQSCVQGTPPTQTWLPGPAGPLSRHGASGESRDALRQDQADTLVPTAEAWQAQSEGG